MPGRGAEYSEAEYSEKHVGLFWPWPSGRRRQQGETMKAEEPAEILAQQLQHLAASLQNQCLPCGVASRQRKSQQGLFVADAARPVGAPSQGAQSGHFQNVHLWSQKQPI